jgi:predicted O-methyltransferase YrrM
MARYSIEFAKYLVGLRAAHTSLTSAETDLLCRLAAGRRSVVEVGVYEGATSRRIAGCMHADGRLYLVDPHVPGTRMEQWLGFSAARFIAVRSVREHADKVRFVRDTSLGAAATLRLQEPADLIFIDADHSYEAVSRDFQAWAPHLAHGGAMALHDSRLSARRPDLGPQAGPVRLVRELLGHAAPAWTVVDAADTLSVLRRAAP